MEMDQSKIVRLKNRIWRRLSKTLSKESVVQAAKTIQRAVAMFFVCGTKRYCIEDEMQTSGAPNIWKTGVTQGKIMEYYKKRIVIFEDAPIIPIGGDGFPGKKNGNSVGEKEEPRTQITERDAKTEEKGVTDIIQQIERNRCEADARQSQAKLTHTERWANRVDHSKCCLGWDFVLGRRDCFGKCCRMDDISTTNSKTNAADIGKSMLFNIDEGDLSNPFLLDIIKENQSSNEASFLDLNLDESDLSNPFFLEMIKERMSAGGESASGGGMDLSTIDEADLSHPFLIDMIKDGCL